MPTSKANKPSEHELKLIDDLANDQVEKLEKLGVNTERKSSK